MKGRKELILEKAIELFNKNGIEYVGMRELAAALDMRIGNVTYYYPTKDDLVHAISKAYTEANTKVHEEYAINGLYDFLSKCGKLFENGVRYRCLMLSIVHVMEQNALVAESYKKVAQVRAGNIAEAIKLLIAEKHLQAADEDEEAFLVGINSLVSRFWYSEAALITKRNMLDTRIPYYLRMQAQLFKPYTTRKGLKDIERFMMERGL